MVLFCLLQDEVHERDRFSDFLLTKLRDLLQKHPTLKLILSSAALDVNLFIRYFGSCPVIYSKLNYKICFSILTSWVIIFTILRIGGCSEVENMHFLFPLRYTQLVITLYFHLFPSTTLCYCIVRPVL